MIDVPIQPAAAVPAAQPAAAAPAAAPTQSGIPDELSAKILEGLNKSPEVQALFSRQIQAAYFPQETLKDLGENAPLFGQILYDVLPAKTGFAATFGPKSGSIILFDPQALSEQQVEEADAAGTLDQMATVISIGAPQAATGQSPAAPAPVANPAAGLLSGPTALGASSAAQAAAASLPPIRQKNPAAGSIVNDLGRRPI